MTIIVDTSVWINVYRDGSGGVASKLAATVGTSKVVMVPFVVTEILQGCRNETEWDLVEKRTAAFELLEIPADLWKSAARIYVDLRRQGKTVRSTLDCCIAHICLVHDCILFHCDRDFETIATIRNLKHVRLDLTQNSP